MSLKARGIKPHPEVKASAQDAATARKVALGNIAPRSSRAREGQIRPRLRSSRPKAQAGPNTTEHRWAREKVKNTAAQHSGLMEELEVRLHAHPAAAGGQASQLRDSSFGAAGDCGA